MTAYAEGHHRRMTLMVDLAVVKQHRLGVLTEDDVEGESCSSPDLPRPVGPSGVTR